MHCSHRRVSLGLALGLILATACPAQPPCPAGPAVPAETGGTALVTVPGGLEGDGEGMWPIGRLNLLDEAPSFVSDGAAFYNRQADPRQRFVYVQIRKSL